MHKLGISIYPEHSTPQKDYEYMKLAAKYGFKRIFTCLLSVKESKEYILKEFGAFMDKAHELGFEVAVDTEPKVFDHLGATPNDISIFHDLKVDIIRLDGHFDDYLDRVITHNPYGIKIEFNGSSDANLDGMIKHGADIHNMIVCHNFYPQRYSGLSWKTFADFNAKWRSLGMHTGAFVSSNNKDTFGPWPVFAGLPTLEMHRNLPIDVQVRHMLSTEMIDDILIGNAYASEEELKIMASVDLSKTTIRLDYEKDLNEAELDILFNITHAGRVDASDYYIRSSRAKAAYTNISVPVRTCVKKMFTRGDVVIVNDNMKYYRGELEIILQDMENDGERNLIGHICEDEMIILDQMEMHPDHMFGFLK